MSTFDHLSREELITLLEKKLAERKLGLVWERNEIEHGLLGGTARVARRGI